MFFEDGGTAVRQRDRSDTYALIVSSALSTPSDAFPYAWDLEFVVEKENATHEFNIVGNDKIETALTRCRELLCGPGTYSAPDAHMFIEGNAIFLMDRFSIGDNNIGIRRMEEIHTLLSMPKYDTAQEQYYTTATTELFTLISVLDHSGSKVTTKGKAVSTSLQLLVENSYTGVRGYYVNRMIKPMYFGQEKDMDSAFKSIEIFDIIMANIRFDYCYIYSPQLNDINHLWRSALEDGHADSLEDMFLADKENFESAIQSTDAWFGLG